MWDEGEECEMDKKVGNGCGMGMRMGRDGRGQGWAKGDG